MHIEWNKVTWYSKSLAIVVFVGSAFLWFYLGMWYQQTVTILDISSLQQSPIYEVPPVASSSQAGNFAGPGEHCGGNIAHSLACSPGYYCAPLPSPLPFGDVGGVCMTRLPSTAVPPTLRECTREAKQCWDGSYVSRTEPNCEFAACPLPHSCTGESQQCPDGSYVGRGGPNCEFAACSAATTTVEGVILDASMSAKVIDIVDSTGREIDIETDANTKFFDAVHNEISLTTFERGSTVRATGYFNGITAHGYYPDHIANVFFSNEVILVKK